MLRVAVIGSGPAGAYTAESLVAHGDTTVDVLERLPCPFGLVRYGVAPDHPKIRSISRALRRVFETPTVRFLGNVEVGSDLSVQDLHRHYDAVVFTVGAAVDRRLGIPGEDLPGSASATEFVTWYCGHPDTPADRFSLQARSVAVIGVGNVALDVTRILAKTADDLKVTDIPTDVLRVLDASAVRDIHLIGRRGPVQAKFTTKELKELGEVAGADVIVDPGDVVLSEVDQELLLTEPGLRRNYEIMRAWSERPPQGRPRRIFVRFLRSPVQILGDSHVEGLRLEENRLDEAGRAVGVGVMHDLDTQLVLRSVGYRGHPIAGLPFDDRTGAVPHDAGRVLRDGAAVPGEYVAGWIKRGPTGVVGTNKHDAHETVASLRSDRDGLPRAPIRDDAAVPALLASRGVDVVDWHGWEAIEAAEALLGATSGREQEKITDRAVLLRTAAAAQA